MGTGFDVAHNTQREVFHFLERSVDVIFIWPLFILFLYMASLVLLKIPDDVEEVDVGAEKPAMRTKVFFNKRKKNST